MTKPVIVPKPGEIPNEVHVDTEAWVRGPVADHSECGAVDLTQEATPALDDTPPSDPIKP